MFYIATCLRTENCGWSRELPKEEYDSFDFFCPECFGPAVTYADKTNVEKEDILDFLLPLIDGEAGDPEE